MNDPEVECGLVVAGNVVPVKLKLVEGFVGVDGRFVCVLGFFVVTNGRFVVTVAAIGFLVLLTGFLMVD